MTKDQLASDIVNDLLDNGMIALEYGSEFYDQGKQEVIEEIKQILNGYVIVDGSVVE